MHETFSSEKKSRPESLKVLCILSFVMSGITFLFYSAVLILTFLYAHDNFYGENWYESWSFLHMINVIVSNFLSFAAVMMMWNLRKSGFFIYVFAETFPWVTATLSLKAASLNPGRNFNVTATSMIVMIIADIIFILLYSRSMKKII